MDKIPTECPCCGGNELRFYIRAEFEVSTYGWYAKTMGDGDAYAIRKTDSKCSDITEPILNPLDTDGYIDTSQPNIKRLFVTGMFCDAHNDEDWCGWEMEFENEYLLEQNQLLPLPTRVEEHDMILDLIENRVCVTEYINECKMEDRSVGIYSCTNCDNIYRYLKKLPEFQERRKK